MNFEPGPISAGNTPDGAYFPLQYCVDFLEFMRAHDDIIEIVTYKDFPWGTDFDYEHSYPGEYQNWRREIRKGTRNARKIYVLLQHDVDCLPERTMAILREEERLGIPANVMIFNRLISRQHFRETGELLYTDYKLDFSSLRRLQDEQGFVFGYHSNALCRTLFDNKRALAIFTEDVAELRRHLDIRFFSPHGGIKDPAGETNNSLGVPQSLRKSIRWVNNRYTVRFNGYFSDGGINSPKSEPAKRDLRDFVRTWKPGCRYRVLLHPQYYHPAYSPSPRMAGTPWYDELLEFYSSEKAGSAWSDVQLGQSQTEGT